MIGLFFLSIRRAYEYGTRVCKNGNELRPSSLAHEMEIRNSGRTSHEFLSSHKLGAGPASTWPQESFESHYRIFGIRKLIWPGASALQVTSADYRFSGGCSRRKEGSRNLAKSRENDAIEDKSVLIPAFIINF